MDSRMPMMFSNFAKVIDKPPLYHYTQPGTVMQILATRSLLTCPTYNFRDDHEYVHGLRLIEARLKTIRSEGTAVAAMPPLMQTLLTKYGVNAGQVLDGTIAHVEYEIRNFDRPRVEIFVACTSTERVSERMAAEYGGFVLNFNWFLPVIGYAIPKPFVTSMLSRVSYDDGEFSSMIMTQGFLFADKFYAPDVDTLLRPMSVPDRESAIAATAAVFLCIFAVNIKRPFYSYEHEWRLKMARLNHSIPTLFSGNDGGFDLRRQLQLSESAEIIDTARGRRCYMDLSLLGRMALEGIDIFYPASVLAVSDPREISEAQQNVQEYLRNTGVMGRAPDVREAMLRRFSAP